MSQAVTGLQRAVATRRIPQHRTRRVREEGGSTGSTAHDSVTVAVLGLLLHVDAVGAGGEVRLVCYEFQCLFTRTDGSRLLGCEPI